MRCPQMPPASDGHQAMILHLLFAVNKKWMARSFVMVGQLGVVGPYQWGTDPPMALVWLITEC